MITELIHEALAAQTDSPRNYISASSIGRQCSRALYYQIHDAPREQVSDRLALTFELGRSAEAMLLDAIEYVHPIKRNVALYGTIIEGHADAMITLDGFDYILEIKTANSASFAQVKKIGVFRWMPQYFDQVQAYMGLSGIEKAIVLVFNKDTSELYEELIELDPLYYELLVERARQIRDATDPPRKLSESPMNYICKMCEFRRYCHE